MGGDILKKNNLYMEEVVVDTPPTEYIEENVFVDEKFIKNKDLIRMDMNLIQSPIFSKNTKRKVNQVVTYFFNRNRDTYIKVTPSAGDYIPGDGEEKIFIALMQIMKERGMPKRFVVTATELKEKLKLSHGKYNQVVKTSLSRLAKTNYEFKNSLYSSENKGVLEKKIETSIFDITTISLKDLSNKKYRDMYDDKRIKEVYEIEFSTHFYKNIIEKGYLVYNGNTLLEIETSTARTIYMLVEKLRFDKMYLKIDTIYLIKRIPLKLDKQNLSQTIKTIEKAFKELINKKLILDFNFIKETTWEKSEIEMNFPENAVIEKQNRFYDDRNDLRKILTSQPEVSDVMNSMLQEVHDIETTNSSSVVVTKEMIDEIMELLPSKAKNLKTMPRTIKESIELYGYDKVKKSAIYTKKQKPEKVRAYFLKALESDWAEDDEGITSLKAVKDTIKAFEEEVNTNTPQYNESLYNDFQELSEDVQAGIEGYAYRDYIKQCGVETKIQRLAFAGSRKKYICEFLEKYPEALKKEDIQEEKVVKPVIVENTAKVSKVITELSELKEMINDAVEMADLVNEYSEDEMKKLKIKIISDVMQHFRRKELTIELLESRMTFYTGV